MLVLVCIGKAAKAELQWKGSELQWKSGELQWKGSNQRPVGGKGATSVLSAGLSFGTAVPSKGMIATTLR